MRETREARLGAISRRRLWPVGDEEAGKAPVGAAVGALGDIADSAAALSEINQRYALAPLSPEAVELRQMALANDRVDRTFERFSPAFLERLGRTLVGKSVLAHHRRGEFPVGRVYAAYLTRDAAGATWLMARYYLVKTEANAELRRQLDAGVYAYVSVGFRGGELLCDLCGGPFAGACGHLPGARVRDGDEERAATFTWHDLYDDCEAVEASLVWLGAQYDARHVKGLLIDDCRLMIEEQGVARCTRHDPNIASSASDTSSPNQQSAISNQQSNEPLYALAADGELYRADLVAEIGRLARLVGAEREAATLASALLPLGAAQLKELKSEYERRVEEKFPPRPFGQTADPASASLPTARPRVIAPRDGDAYRIL